MPIVTLLTDFGIVDEYVGVVKGVVLSVNPCVSIVDITHQIDPQDVESAARMIESARRYFPPATIHVIVVDPGVGGDRAIITLETGDQVFLAPNNGVLSYLVGEQDHPRIFRVDNPRYFLKEIGTTFHGRDIY